MIMENKLQHALAELWRKYGDINEILSKNTYCYSEVSEQYDILFTGINPSARVKDEDDCSEGHHFKYQEAILNDRYFRTIDEIIPKTLKDKVAYLDLFNYRRTKQGDIVEFLKTSEGISFLAENLCINQLIIENIIKPKVICVRNKGSWGFWGKNATPQGDNNVWMGYKFRKVQTSFEQTEGTLEIYRIEGLINNEQRVSFFELPDTNLKGTIIAFAKHYQYSKKEERITENMIKELYKLATE
jgi:hypothetical protein